MNTDKPHCHSLSNIRRLLTAVFASLLGAAAATSSYADFGGGGYDGVDGGGYFNDGGYVESGDGDSMMGLTIHGGFDDGGDFSAFDEFGDFGFSGNPITRQSGLDHAFSPAPPDGEQPGYAGCSMQGNPTTDHPVMITTGDKVLSEEDFSSRGFSPLRLVRTYSSSYLDKVGIFGPYWSSSYDYSLSFQKSTGQYCTSNPGYPILCGTDSTNLSRIYLNTPTAGRYIYTWDSANNRWKDQKAASQSWIIRRADGTWQRHSEDGTTEIYDRYGFILSITDLRSIGWTFEYNNYRLARVRHSSGAVVTFGWTQDRVTSVTDPDGRVFTYGYKNYMLERVNYPASSSASNHYASVDTPVNKTYHYDSVYLARLEGVSVNGVRYSYYQYDSSRRVSSSGLTAGIEKSTFSYGTNSTTVTNALGASTTYNHQLIAGARRVTSITRSNVTRCPDATASTIYDENGMVSSTTDWIGNTTNYDYNSAGQLLRKTTGVNPTNPGHERTVELTWDAKNRVINKKTFGAAIYDPQSEVSYEYYPDGNAAANWIRSITIHDRSYTGTAQSRHWEFSYSINSATHIPSQVTVLGPQGGATTYTYLGQGIPETFTNALGHQTVYRYDDIGLGLPSVITDSRGSNVYTYDVMGRVISLYGPRQWLRYQYNPLGQVTTVTFRDYSTIKFSYDAAGRVIERMAGDWETERYTYDALSDVTSVTRSDLGGQIAYQRFWDFDSIGRVVAVRLPSGFQATFTYDANSNITAVQRVGYGSPTYLSYTPNNQLSQMVERDGRTTTWTYDGGGRVASVRDPKGRLSTYEYDGFGQIRTVNNADVGIQRFQYDDAGRLTSRTANDNTTRTYRYDALDRPTYLSGGVGNTIQYTYDSCTGGQGQLCTVADNSGTTAYTYTSDGLLASQLQTIKQSYVRLNGQTFNQALPTISYGVNWAYDVAGRVKDISYPGGIKVHYTNDKEAYGSRVSTVDVVMNGIQMPLVNRALYYPFDGLRSVDLNNYITNVRTQNPDGRTTRIAALQHTYPRDIGVQDHSYSFSDEQISFITNPLAGDKGPNAVTGERLLYDASGALTERRYFETGSLGGVDAYRYDPNGNRLSHDYNPGAGLDSINSPPEIHEQYVISNSSNRINNVSITQPATAAGVDWKSSRVFSYDGRGNQTRECCGNGEKLYGYDSLDRLTGFTQYTASPFTTVQTSAAYFTNGLNLRVRKYATTELTDYVYSPSGTILSEASLAPFSLPQVGTGVVGDTSQLPSINAGVDDASTSTVQWPNNNGIATTNYVWLEGKPIALIREGSIYYIHNDQTGRPEVITNQSQEVVWEAANSPFERRATTDLIGGMNLGFPGQYRDAESGLYYNFNRYYDPTLGRYTQPDPLGLVGGINPYVYAGNNPIIYTDPTGLICFSSEDAAAITGGVGGFVGGAIVGGAPGAVVGFLAGVTAGGIQGRLGGIPGDAVGGAVAGAISGVAQGPAYIAFSSTTSSVEEVSGTQLQKAMGNLPGTNVLAGASTGLAGGLVASGGQPVAGLGGMLAGALQGLKDNLTCKCGM